MKAFETPRLKRKKTVDTLISLLKEKLITPDKGLRVRNTQRLAIGQGLQGNRWARDVAASWTGCPRQGNIVRAVSALAKSEGLERFVPDIKAWISQQSQVVHRLILSGKRSLYRSPDQVEEMADMQDTQLVDSESSLNCC